MNVFVTEGPTVAVYVDKDNKVVSAATNIIPSLKVEIIQVNAPGADMHPELPFKIIPEACASQRTEQSGS